MTANDAMLQVAKEVAEKYNFITVDEGSTFNLRHSDFWYDSFRAIDSEYINGEPLTIKVCKYIKPVFEEEKTGGCNGRPHIDIDSYWCKPRLNVSLEDKTFVAMTYTDGKCSEVQAFGEKALYLAIELKTRLDELINSTE